MIYKNPINDSDAITLLRFTIFRTIYTTDSQFYRAANVSECLQYHERIICSAVHTDSKIDLSVDLQNMSPIKLGLYQVN